MESSALFFIIKKNIEHFLTSRSFLYLLFMLVLGGTCDRTALMNDYMIAEKVSALGQSHKNSLL